MSSELHYTSLFQTKMFTRLICIQQIVSSNQFFLFFKRLLVKTNPVLTLICIQGIVSPDRARRFVVEVLKVCLDLEHVVLIC